MHTPSLVTRANHGLFLTHNRMAGRTRKQMAIQKLNRNRQTDDVIYLTLGGDACGSVDAAWLIDNHPRHQLAVLFFLGSVLAVRALVYRQAVDFVLDRKVFQLAEVVRIVFLKYRNRAAVAGHVNSLETGIIFDHVATVGCRKGSDYAVLF